MIMNLAKFFQKGNFGTGFICGILFSVCLGLTFIFYPNARAAKPNQIDIIYKVVAQNFYQVQIASEEEPEAMAIGSKS